jgi:hypothetical protein
MDGIRDTSFSGQAEQRIPYFTIAGFSLVARNSYKLSLNTHPPTPIAFQRVIVGFVRFFYRKPFLGQSRSKKLKGFSFFSCFRMRAESRKRAGPMYFKKIGEVR